MDNIELKRCPFCNSMEITVKMEETNSGQEIKSFYCANCMKRPPTLKPGLYKSEFDNEYGVDWYRITIEVKETEKAYIFRLVELKERYSADRIKILFKNSNRVVIKKNNSNHAIKKFSDHDFTIYPFRDGIPYWFVKVAEREVTQNEENT